MPPPTTPASRVGGATTASRRPIPAPFPTLRLPSLWVLILPLSSRTRTPIALSLMSSSALSQRLSCSTASSAAASSLKNARTTVFAGHRLPSLVAESRDWWGSTTAVTTTWWFAVRCVPRRPGESIHHRTRAVTGTSEHRPARLRRRTLDPSTTRPRSHGRSHARHPPWRALLEPVHDLAGDARGRPARRPARLRHALDLGPPVPDRRRPRRPDPRGLADSWPPGRRPPSGSASA